MRAHPPVEPARDRTAHTIRNPFGRHGLGHRGERTRARRVHGPIAQEREEDAGQPTRERDHGDARAAPGGDAAGPLPQRGRAGMVEAEHRDRGLDEASTSCARRERAASSSAATKAAAVTGPIWGTLCRRRTRSSVCVTAAIRSSE
jgi:hypothetical protein